MTGSSLSWSYCQCSSCGCSTYFVGSKPTNHGAGHGSQVCDVEKWSFQCMNTHTHWRKENNKGRERPLKHSWRRSWNYLLKFMLQELKQDVVLVGYWVSVTQQKIIYQCCSFHHYDLIFLYLTICCKDSVHSSLVVLSWITFCLFILQTFVNDIRIQEQIYVTLKIDDKLRFGYDILLNTVLHVCASEWRCTRSADMSNTVTSSAPVELWMLAALRLLHYR